MRFNQLKKLGALALSAALLVSAMLPAMAKPYFAALSRIQSREENLPSSHLSAIPSGSVAKPVENISGSTSRSVSGGIASESLSCDIVHWSVPCGTALRSLLPSAEALPSKRASILSLFSAGFAHTIFC